MLTGRHAVEQQMPNSSSGVQRDIRGGSRPRDIAKLRGIGQITDVPGIDDVIREALVLVELFPTPLHEAARTPVTASGAVPCRRDRHNRRQCYAAKASSVGDSARTTSEFRVAVGAGGVGAALGFGDEASIRSVVCIK